MTGYTGISSWKVDISRCCGHTFGMKVAVSIPDRTFESAEALAKRLKTSRSEIYARALNEFIGNHAPNELTEAMNLALDAVGEEDLEFSREAARRVFRQVEW